ncbi:MAG TPA: redox-regulated ATPase YchF [Candidatus Nanoarchaeia archaeon]|nr:redox-regulated ATPase YchF [Candidatus Nanoarchaeia archaeon]
MLLGLVGKPSVGKSTFFKAATMAEVDIASYPFTTIDSSTGVGYVKIECVDKEFEKNGKPAQCNPNYGFCINHKRFVPVKLADVAGLVPGASEGKGLGNQFLDDLREADVFIHIVDVSGKTNEKGEELSEPTHNPNEDVKFLEQELDNWFYNILSKSWKNICRKVEVEDRKIEDEVVRQLSGLKVKQEHVKEVLLFLDFSEKPQTWSEEQLKNFVSELRKKSKPMIIAANKVDEEKGKENYNKLRSDFPHLNIVPCSADSELALRQASKAGLIEYVPGERDFKILKELGEKQKQALDKIKKNVLDVFLEGTGVQSVLNQAVFSLLKYIAVFPASANKLEDSKGNVLPDCFLMPPGSTALDFAYSLHSDFGRGFVKAIDARTKKPLGKDYELKHRDALEIMSK